MSPGVAVMASPRSRGQSDAMPGRKITRTLDLRGQVCPGPTVDTKLALDELAPGDVLEVVLDYYPALQTIPDLMSELPFPCELQQGGGAEFRFFITKA